MDEFQDGYQPDENYGGQQLVEGDYAVKIHNITFKPTKNGDPMMTIDLITKDSPIVFKHRIVKNDYFNSNMTKFFDCFKIPRGNFEYQRWLERVGKCHIAKGEPNAEGKAYMEIKYLIVDAKAASPTPQAQVQRPAAPAQQFHTTAPQQPLARQTEPAGSASFDDDIPWKGTF